MDRKRRTNFWTGRKTQKLSTSMLKNPTPIRHLLGVMIDDTDDGVVITDMTDGSAAGAAGLRRGDVLLKINDKYIFTSNGLIDALKPYNPTEAVKVRYIREGKEKSVSVTLKARK
jgi:S1-C subfamily serine protease